jgi:phytoene dehydrogenase-like protein
MIDVAIVGAGLAGLRCAAELEKAGAEVTLLEAADAPGGRVRTDMVDGFRLDRGFQVLLTEYPEAKKVLDYDALRLREMTPGALVWHGGRLHRFADPFRQPLQAVASLFDGMVPLGDKLRVALLRARVNKGEIAELFAEPETTSYEFLRGRGFSEAMVDRFFRPFFGGVFLEKELRTSSRFFQFLFRMFSDGPVAVPELGMGEIAAQMAAKLRPGTLVCGAQVTGAVRTGSGFSIRTEDGREVMARTLVVAAGVRSARLFEEIGLAAARVAPEGWNRTTTVYFAAEKAPVEEPTLVLNGEGTAGGPVNHLAVMSRVSARYAPAGAELIAANVVGEAPIGEEDVARLEDGVRSHARRMFGAQVDGWRRLATYAIPEALPVALSVQWEAAPVLERDSVYLCGDVAESPSVQGALVSGRRVAEKDGRRGGG